MDINDDLITFFEWAVLMGVPPILIPSFQVMQTTLRARIMIVMDMVQKVRPRQEVQLIRDNILITRMRKLKDKDLPMSVRSFIPERYHRYETMRETNRKIKDISEKLDRIKLQSSKMMENIKHMNITKTKIRKCSEDTIAKRKILEAKLLMLSADVEKVKQQEDTLKYNAILYPDGLNMDEDRAILAISKSKTLLDNFYKNYNSNCTDKSTKSHAKCDLFASIRRNTQGLPNLVLYRSIHKSIGNELECLLAKDVPSNMNRSAAIEETIAKNISDAYQRFILRSNQLDAERDTLHTITDNYEQLYTKLSDSSVKILSGVCKEVREDFMKESAHFYLNEGRIAFLHSEISRNKCLLRERSGKMRDMVESQETVKEVIRQSQSGLSSMVSDMKQMQKISNQLSHMRDLTEKHVQMMRGDFKPGAKFGAKKKFNTCIPDDVKGLTLIEELKLFSELPMSYLNTLDTGLLFRRNCPIYMYKPDVIRASRSAHLVTVQGFMKQVKDVCNLQMYLSTIDKKRDFNMPHIPVDVEESRKKEFEQNQSIFRLLKMVDIQMQLTEEMMVKCKAYYNFLMTTPLKNYIQPCLKMDGKTFSQVESEFLLYYRMIRGVEKIHEEME